MAAFPLVPSIRLFLVNPSFKLLSPEPSLMEPEGNATGNNAMHGKSRGGEQTSTPLSRDKKKGEAHGHAHVMKSVDRNWTMKGPRQYQCCTTG